jgi:hypothetical protein
MFDSLLKPDSERFPEREAANHADRLPEYVEDKTA